MGGDRSSRDSWLEGAGPIVVTASERQKHVARVLEKATEELSASLDYERALEGVVAAVVPAFADWCLVELVERGEPCTLTVTSVGSSKRRSGQSLEADPSQDGLRRGPLAPVITARVVATGRPLLVPELTDAELATYARDPAHLEQLRALQIRSVICVPIVVAEGGVAGTLMLLSTGSRRAFDARDLRFASKLGRRAGTTVGLARAYRAAKDAVRARDDFLAVAGHELRTPLATLVLQLESLKAGFAGGTLSPATAAERVHRTLQQTNRLNRLIDALLDVTRVTAGQLVLEPEPMDLAELVRDVCERFVEEATREDVTITVAADAPCEGTWDPRRLDQVVSNLVSNAIKYGEGSPVRVICKREAAKARIQVIDGGIGISAADTDRIFGRFERAPSARDRGGFGLGLWIAREIVSAHRGTITVESEQGKGSTFTIDLPPRPTGRAAEEHETPDDASRTTQGGRER